MIIAIDNKTGKAYYGKTKTEIARQVKVHPNTIANWMKNGIREKYNRYTVYFECIELKTHKGFAFTKIC